MDVDRRRLLARNIRVWPGRRLTAGQRSLVTILVVALGYCVAGRLGTLLSVPPNFATAVWPPSGIALAAVLLFGPRIWPGVLAGAFLVNAASPWFDSEWSWSAIIDVTIAVSISLGATLQALLGAYLIRRTVGFPDPLIRDRKILAFLVLGGPVSCMIAPTWGVASLAFAGRLEGLVPLAQNWWTWWVGDTIGVILFAPLTLICFARPRSVWRPRRVSVALPLIGALIVTIIGFALTYFLDERRARSEIKRIAASSQQALDFHIDRPLQMIDSLQRYMAYSQVVSRTEFSRWNQDYHFRCPAARMIAWAPVDDTAADASVDAGVQPIRFSVEYVYPEGSPLRSMLLAQGDAFGSDPNLRQLIEKCCSSGSRIASAPFLGEEGTPSDGDRHVMILAPVYHQENHATRKGARRKELKGLLLGVINITALVRSSIPLQDVDTYDLLITDVTDPTSPVVACGLERESSGPQTGQPVPYLRPGFEVPSTIRFAGRVWDCRRLPTADFYGRPANRHYWMVLASGLAMTALLGSFLMILSGRTAQIEASEALYLDLYENAPDMLISLDVGSQRIIECNRTFLDSTGLAKPCVIDKHVYELFDRDSHTEARRAFRAFLTAGQVSDVELRLHCQDGSKIDISMKMSAVRAENGESIICRAALRDITARKRIEADLKAQEMELAHAGRLSMMGEMAAGLAHEINQPLGAIAAYAEGALIRLRDAKPDPESLGQILQRIADDAHRAGQVIRRLRQFLAKRPPERTDVQVNDLVREVAQFVDADLRSRDVRLGIDLGRNMPCVQGDPIQLQQVLLNLVRNACDAMQETAPSRRHMMIRTRSGDRENIEVTVEDCGHGLSSTMNDQLFETFFSTKDEGLGMGLAISRSIIESHGGQIWATSNLEGGASFYFTLPASLEVFA